MLDVVILSNAKNEELFGITWNCINSVLKTICPKMTIYVIEQNQDESQFGWAYFFDNQQNIKTIYPEEKDFNYNRFANIGAFAGNSEYICIANNDLIFTPTWFWEVFKVEELVCSPRCPDDKRQQDIKENEIGEQVGRHLSGWCFVIKRSVWEQIGGFDEDFSFWCADNSLMEQLLSIGIKPMVLANSYVKHLGSKTLKTMDNRDELTRAQVLKYNRKYNRNLFGWGI